MFAQTFKTKKSILSLAGLLVVLFIIPVTVYLVINARSYKTPAAGGSLSTPLIDQSDAVVIAERKICSMVGQNQTAVGITGEDGGESVKVGNTTYFAFGDTNTTNSGQIPNSVATTTDNDASDCVSMTSKNSGGIPQPMIGKLPTECTLWPMDMVNTSGNNIYFFYYSFSSTNCTQRLNMGLGKMDATTLATTRINNTFWQPNDSVTPNFDIYGAAFAKSGTDVYVVWDGQDTTGKDMVMLSKVAPSNIENKSSYAYWDGTNFQSDPAKLKPLWDQGSVATNGMTVRYNNYLSKWVVTYNTGYSSIMVQRTADNITGPWSSEKTIINCQEHFGLSSNSPYPCYGAREHPEYEKNNGQIIYASHSNYGLYQPFLHEIIYGKAVNQWVDFSGNAIYATEGTNLDNDNLEGAAFYASPNPIANFDAIHDWNSGPEHIYSSSSPGSGFVDGGIAFYAPTTQQYSLAPIYRWDKGSLHRYSALNLAQIGYTKGPLAFYAKITNYRVTDQRMYLQNASLFEVGVKANGNWVSGVHLTFVSLAQGIQSPGKSIVTSTPFLGNRFFGQNILNQVGGVSYNGDLPYVNTVKLGAFKQDQPLDTSSTMFTDWVHHTGVVDNPAEIGHQVNPYAQATNFKSFFLTSSASGNYDGAVCSPDCGGAVVSSGSVSFCGNDVTLTPTGPTVCASLGGVGFSNLAPNTNYDVYECAPSCDYSLINVAYQIITDSNGAAKLYYTFDSTNPDPNKVYNSSSLALLITTWGSTTDLRADINGDGKVNSADLALLIAHWGQ
ncbi:MAG TPA: DUF4185 domain-containing protein [Candidatus Saccharimonadales bacterium]|nr:DUF4185 domain-containing protein [Candidatus Saccharimonadales bacterium]